MVHRGEKFIGSFLLALILLGFGFVGAVAVGHLGVLGACTLLVGEKSHVFDYFLVYEASLFLEFDAGLALVFVLVD